MSKPKSGLFIALKEDIPTIIRFNGQEVEIYLNYLKCGASRARIVADRDVQIIGPSRVRKGFHKEEVKS